MADNMASSSQYTTEKSGPSGELRKRQVRQVYLITHSLADMSAIPTRMAFAEKVLAGFRDANIDVRQWVCCLEAHRDGEKHFHMAIKMGRLHRWVAVKNYQRLGTLTKLRPR